ncbi:MAG: hypothetical protein WCX29_04395 [Candidatus Peribacteraceae bacterium]|nr:hypothetical protein [Candidatus Peribacteria bacterium]
MFRADGSPLLDLRYYFLSVHYRTQLKFTKKCMEDAHKARRKSMEWIQECKEGNDCKESLQSLPSLHSSEIYTFEQAFRAAMNTESALAEAMIPFSLVEPSMISLPQHLFDNHTRDTAAMI